MIDDWNIPDDPFDNFDDNNDNESDDDFEEIKRKKSKKVRIIIIGFSIEFSIRSLIYLQGKGSGKKRSEINPEDKPFVCDKCGVKYKTKPGLTYHFQKMHNNNNTSNTNNASSHTNLQHTNSHSSDVHIEAVINPSRKKNMNFHLSLN